MKAIFFDLYETLVSHFDPDWSPPPRSIAQRLGLEDRQFTEGWGRFDSAWQRGEIGSYGEALAQLCATCGSEPDRAVLAELSREYQTTTRRVFERIEPEIIEMVAALRDRGFRLGIITNASDLDAEPWPGCDLAPYFDDFVASHDIGLLKSDGRIFELACHRLDVRPEETVFVGDGGGNELHNASRAGLTVYWCSWFLDRWPEGIRPNGFPGDDWRQRKDMATASPYPRLKRPPELIHRIEQRTPN